MAKMLFSHSKQIPSSCVVTMPDEESVIINCLELLVKKFLPHWVQGMAVKRVQEPIFWRCALTGLGLWTVLAARGYSEHKLPSEWADASR